MEEQTLSPSLCLAAAVASFANSIKRLAQIGADHMSRAHEKPWPQVDTSNSALLRAAQTRLMAVYTSMYVCARVYLRKQRFGEQIHTRMIRRRIKMIRLRWEGN